MLPANTQFIKNAVKVRSDSQKAVMDGFISGSLDAFQRKAVDGILKSGMPSGEHSPSPTSHKPLVSDPKGVKSGDLKKKMSGKEPKTKLKDGFMPYPGSSVSA
jgi:hypothetical protein